MKITVGRLKTIINEEIKHFKEGRLMPDDDDPTGTNTEYIQRLKAILKKWAEAEYDSDEVRHQSYAEDIQDFIDAGKSGGHDCGCEHPDQSHEEEEVEEEPKPKKKGGFPYESKKIEQMVYQRLITALGG